MIVMPANVTSPEVRRMAAEYPGMIGNLYSPGPGWWQKPIGEYALDNGRFTQGEEWRAYWLFDLYSRAGRHTHPPMWVLVPDVVSNWPATLKEWDKWAPVIAELGWPLAVAVQDGSSVADVKAMGADVVFVGGSTRFKYETLAKWCAAFPRVHVGRVNTPREGWRCFKAGAESIDGTGWMRTDRQRAGLWLLLESMRSGIRPTDPTLFGCEETAA